MPRLSYVASLVIFSAVLPAAIAFAEAVINVSQKNRAFQVSTATLAAGNTLRFVNEDEFIHQVYVNSPQLSFESPEQNPGELIELRFPVSGTFEVRCHIHPKMLLTVNVH